MADRLLLLAVLVLAVGSVRWYFIDYTPLRVYGSFNAVVATALGKYAHQTLGPDWRMYFFGPPRMYVGFGTIPYLAPEVEGKDVVERLAAPPDQSLVRPDKHAAFVFLPERRAELDLVRRRFPNGQMEEIPSPLSRDPLFIVYRVANPSMAGAGLPLDEAPPTPPVPAPAAAAPAAGASPVVYDAQGVAVWGLDLEGDRVRNVPPGRRVRIGGPQGELFEVLEGGRLRRVQEPTR